MGREALQRLLAQGGLLTVFGESADSPDVSIQPLNVDPSLALVTSVDVFTAISADPYRQGFIACANALSDVYAVGVTSVESVLMIVGVCVKIPEPIRDVVYAELFRGFTACCAAAGTRCRGGQTIFTSDFLIGGSVSAVARQADLLPIKDARVGDLLVLTKPLGTQIAANLAVWLTDEKAWAEKVGTSLAQIQPVTSQAYTASLAPSFTAGPSQFTASDATCVISASEQSMMRLNRQAAVAALAANAHASTDVTGFGLLGHARNLVEMQTSEVDFVISRLPVFRGVKRLRPQLLERLKSGSAPETSGGLFLAIAEKNLPVFAEAMKGEEFWVVGNVEGGNRQVRLERDADIFEV